MNLYKLRNKSQSSTGYRFLAGQDDVEAIVPPSDGSSESKDTPAESSSIEANVMLSLPQEEDTQPFLEELQVGSSDISPSHNRGHQFARRRTESVLNLLKERLPRMAEKLERLRDKKSSLSDVEEPPSQEISYLRQSGSEPSICDVGELVEEGVECCDDTETKPLARCRGSKLKTPVSSMTLSSLKDLDYENQFRVESLSPASTSSDQQIPPSTDRLEVPAIPSIVHPPPPASSPPATSFLPASLLSFRNISLFIITLSLAILLSAPFKSFSQGFFVGTALSFLVCLAIWRLAQPHSPRQRPPTPQFTDLPLSIPIATREDEDPNVFKGWMNELSKPYDPDTFQTNDTSSVFVTINKTTLELSYPKANIPRRAMWNEPVHKHIFVKKKFYNISSASLMLLPVGISAKRRWSRRYPIQIAIPPTANTLEPSNMEPASNGTELLLFARTDREKEEWHQRFQNATKSSTQDDSQATDPELQVLPNLVSPQLPLPQQLEFSRFIVSLFHSSQSAKGKLSWLNVMIGRLLFPFLVHEHWNIYIRKKIQKKLNKLRLPDVVEELKVVEADLGTNLPQVLKVSEPQLNDRGVWLDVELLYEGTASATLETKVNLLQAARPRDPLVLLDDESPNSSSNEDLSNLDSLSTSPSGRGKQWLVDRIARSQYFQLVVENKYIKRKVEEMSNTPLVLKVEVRHLHGTLALNLPPHPSDRLWYGFRGLPTLDLHASPTLGTYQVRYDPITDWIERRLILELQKLLVLPNMDDFQLSFLGHGPS